MSIDTLASPEQAEALEVAKSLAAAGIPVFVADPDEGSSTGYRLPARWQQTPADPAILDAWAPGKALGVVMGHGLDLLDLDPRSGGDPSSLNGSTPTSYGIALTPSGGMHSFIRSLGVRSRDNVLPGIDVKAGAEDGKGRGFAFIAPTVRVSKVTGQPTAYRWGAAPDLTRLTAVLRGELVDDSGQGLRDLIAAAKRSVGPDSEAPPYDGPAFEEMEPEAQERVRQWLSGAVEGVRADLLATATWSPGQTDDRGRGWEKIQADAALRLGRLARATWNDLELTDAESVFMEAAPVDGTWGYDDVALKWRLQSGRLDPAPLPDLRTASERDAEGWAAMGLNPRPAVMPGPAAEPSTGGTPPGGGSDGPVSAVAAGEPPSGDQVATRYFGPGGIQAATMAGDVLALGPLRTGVDHVMWAYTGGVWRADKRVVERRLTDLLGQRYRNSYVGTVEAFVRAHVDTITCEPVAELINFRNGLLDWRSGELLPHDPAVPSTVQLGVDYDPDADCPAFAEFVEQVVPADVVSTIWELIGYLLYSGNPLHKAVMLTGTGRNGKGTFLRTLESVLDSRNLTSVSLHDLVNVRFTTASLFGKLANIAGDIDATYMENTATFKQITGGDTISAEHKGRDRFDFKPWAVPMFSANKIPASADTSVGYLARWLVIPFPYSFVGREDRHLDARLSTPEELRGVAARGLRSLAGLLDRGDFGSTESGELAREDFYRRVDQVRTWLAECCEVRPEHPFVARTELYAAYKQWAFRDGHKPVRASEFYERLEQAGGEPATIRGTRGFKRIWVQDNGLLGPVSGGWHPGAPGSTPLAPPTGTVPAPQGVAAVSAGQPQDSNNEGARGAETPHPPYARDVQVGGLGQPAPCAPRTKSAGTYSPELGTGLHNVDDRPNRHGRVDADRRQAHAADLDARSAARRAERAAKKTRQSKLDPEEAAARRAAAAEKRAEIAAEKRAAKVAEAAGEYIGLPAVVTRDTLAQASLEQVDVLLGTITGEAGHGALTVDVETSGYPVGHHDFALRTVQLGDEVLAVVLDPAEPDQADVARRHLAAARVLHAHSATADLIPLAVAGLLDLEHGWARMIDTAILAKLSDPASTGNDADLKNLSSAVLGEHALSKARDAERSALFKAGAWLTDTEVTTPVAKSGWAQVDSGCATMVRYAAADVLDDAALARRLPQPPPAVLERERITQRMTARVAHHGVPLDGEHVERLLETHTAARADHADLVRALSPDGVVENPGSGPQLGEAFTRLGVQLPLTAKGKPSVAKGVLEPMRNAGGPAGDLARAVLDYRHHNTAIGLFLEPYRELVRRGDGRARPTVYTLGADTGRMSCVRPNLQQVPRTGGFRACITADPGHLLVSADFASVELRVAAALSNDHALAEMLSNGVDVHAQIARLAFGPGAGKAERYLAKPMVFGRIYGSGVDGLARDNGVTPAVARSVIDAMDALTPELSAWSADVRGAIESGRTQYPTAGGRVIHLPKEKPHAGPNYCIQGTARELLVDALMRWRQTRWGEAVLWPVHDEVVVMVPEHEAAEATAALVACMTSELAGIPIIAEPSEPTYAWSDSA